MMANKKAFIANALDCLF